MWAKGGGSQRGPDYSLERCQEPELVCACTRVCLILPSRLPPSARPNTPTQGWNPAAPGSIRVSTKSPPLKQGQVPTLLSTSHTVLTGWSGTGPVLQENHSLYSLPETLHSKVGTSIAHGEPSLGNEPKSLLPQSALISSCPNFLCPEFLDLLKKCTGSRT